MKGLKLKIGGIPRRLAKIAIRDEQHLLASKQKLLQRQRALQAARLLRIDQETEEIKRRIAAVQARVFLIQKFEEEDLKQIRKSPSFPKIEEPVKPSVPETKPAAEEALRPPKPKLGDLLINNGLITKEQLEEAFALQGASGGRLGDILIELGYVTAEQLLPYLTNQTKGRLGDLLVQEGYLTKDQLEKALIFQKKSGGMLGDVLLSLQFLQPEQLYRAIATQHNIGRIGNEVDFDVDMKLPETTARDFGSIVIHQYPNRYLVAVNPPLSDERKAELEQIIGSPIEQVLASENEMELFWSEVYGSEMLDESTTKLAIEQPHNSASVTFTKSQLATAGITLGLLIAGLAWSWKPTLIGIVVTVQIFYFLMTAFKFLIILNGSRTNAQYRYTDEELANLNERDLPVYSILVPMYKESEIIPSLIRNLNNLDYPKAKLDIRLLIEADDIEAQEKLAAMKLPSYYTVLVVPDSQPKTKPKACNFGLIRARGEYIVIFDAEDRPDPDQLKKVHLTFMSCSENTVCVQAKLNYFNSEQNILTRWFTQEYSMWFELLLPGIMSLNIPIPLGGTSNHFKTSVLKSLNAWDPYNVTEDADLGIRLYKEGYQTAIVDSRTWEEANSRFGNWVRQRSRWIKGYMQTWLVHMRNPIKLFRELGFRGFLGFQVMVLATPLIPLLNPVFWSLIVLWYGWKLAIIQELFPGVIYYIAAIELFLANFFFVYSNIVGVYWIIVDMEKKNQNIIPYRLVKYALISPLYWIMMSIASYKAAWQLITKPFYWEKTIHGLDHASDEAQSMN